ncbi:MAG: DUF4173 domain-containing protein [Candidatus Melainabacteria bacterium]|nr:DUF4173 domain-containing protein [Candidatus Melainabacteria bacterium]
MQTSLWMLLSAIGLGVVGRYLLGDTIDHSTPPGAGLSVFVLLNLCAVSAALLLLRHERVRALIFFAPAALAATGLLLNDSAWLTGLDIFAFWTSATLGIFAATCSAPALASVKGTLYAITTGALAPLPAAVDLIAENIANKALVGEAHRKHIKAVTKGLLLATPLLFIFTALFCAADQAFANQVGNLFHFNLGKAVEITVTTSILAFCCGGALQAVTKSEINIIGEEKSKTCSDKPEQNCESKAEAESKTTMETNASWGISKPNIESKPDAESKPKMESKPDAESKPKMESKPEAAPTRFHLGMTEAMTALALLNLLFGAFVAIQIKYLFGGASLVNITSGLTYSEYARHGFFELCWAASMVLPILLAAEAYTRRLSKKSEITFRLLAGTLVALLLVVVASAVQRMQLYSQEYGLSELRFFTTAFMAYLTTICLAFAVTVLNARREKFIPATYTLGLLAIAILHQINPENLIQSKNMTMAPEKIDITYALSMSDDSIPALVNALPKLPAAARQQVASNLLARTRGAWKTDWRSFNLSRTIAYHTVQDHIKELEVMAQTP